MKLRLLYNSIRLRLTQGEVAALADTGRVAETLDFGGGNHFSCVLVTQLKCQDINAVLEPNMIVVTVPSAAAIDFASTDLIGLTTEQPVHGGEPLRIAIEKDFKCLHPADDRDNFDTFPNPNLRSSES